MLHHKGDDLYERRKIRNLTAMGIAGLCEAFDLSRNTMRKMLCEKGIYELFGKSNGRVFYPDEILIIFSLIYAPGMYYDSYAKFEHMGRVKKLWKKYGVEEFLAKRNSKKRKA